jgi:hypothetical protein
MRRNILQQIEERCRKEDEKFERHIYRVSKLFNSQVSLSGDDAGELTSPERTKNKCKKY